MPDRSREKKSTKVTKRNSTNDADIAPSKPKPADETSPKNLAAVELGRKGGLKGGKARAAKLTKEERSESAKKAARARWDKQKLEG